MTDATSREVPQVLLERASEIVATVDLTPSPEGFARIAERFAEQVLDDVKVARKASDRVLLISLIEIVASLGQSNPTLIAFLIARLDRKVPASAR